MTSMAITDTAKVFEAGSFALVAALGLYLLARKGRQALAMLRGGDAHAHHHHHGTIAARPSQGQASGIAGAAAHASRHARITPRITLPRPSPRPQAGGGLAGAAAAVLSVGIRPCSGALVVLVFALAQGIFWAGVASTFLMALGTAITVAALAALAVGAKDIARRLHGRRRPARRSGHARRWSCSRRSSSPRSAPCSSSDRSTA